VQRRGDVVDLVAGDAGEARWQFAVDVTWEGDLRGPFVQGRKGDRFFYLSWGTVDAAGGFTMFRRAKLMLDDVDAGTIDDACAPGQVLVATLALTDGKGGPRCAAVRPPAISWTAVPAG